MSDHAKYSPSTSKRWLNCTMSMVLPEKQIEQKENAYSLRGTAIHAAAEDLYISGEIKEEYEGYKLTEDDIKGTLIPYVDYIKEIGLKDHLHSIRMLEQKVVIIPELCYGTADFINYNPITKTLDVVDLKAGQGVFVRVVNNTQLALYAIGAYRLLRTHHDIENVFIHIVQPGMDNIAKINIPKGELLALYKEVKKVIAELESKNKKYGVYYPSEENCRWCPHKLDCPKLNETAIQAAKNEFASYALADKMKILPQLKVFIKAVEDEALKTLQQDNELPGFKLVRGKGNRKWKNEEDAEAILIADSGITLTKDLYNPRKLKTVAQIEKILKKNKVDYDLTELIERGESAPRVAEDSNELEAIDRKAEAKNDFKDI